MPHEGRKKTALLRLLGLALRGAQMKKPALGGFVLLFGGYLVICLTRLRNLA